MSSINQFFNNGEKYSSILKMIFIAFLVMVLLIPLGFILSTVSDREFTYKKVKNELINSHGGEQVFAGPILHVPYLTWKQTVAGVMESQRNMAHFLPEILDITGTVETMKRNRSIYEITVYTANLKLTGSFLIPDFSEWNIPARDILWDEAALSIDFPIMKALTKQVLLKWDDSLYNFQSNTSKAGIYENELTTRIKKQDILSNSPHSFKIELSLNGGGSLNFLPMANATSVSIQSSWKSPGFEGQFLPSEKILDDSGFKAKWFVPSIARGFPQQWQNHDVDNNNFLSSAFGMNLIIPVDTYQKTTRSLKYGILFLSISFLMFFLFEIFSKNKIHPFQYLMVGFANCVFYLLLLSFSEHVNFNFAYTAASVAVVALISFYSAAVLKSRGNTMLLIIVLILSYIFLYVILLSEDYALLIGSVGIFAILAILMSVTRKIDWYKLKNNKTDTGNPSV